MTVELITWTPPTTDEDWNAAIIEGGVHIKWHNEPERPAKYPSSQLENMLALHQEKLVSAEKEKDTAVALLDSLGSLSESQVAELLTVGFIPFATVDEYVDFRRSQINKYTKLVKVVDLLTKEIEFREAGTYARSPIGTTYYIDADSGNNGNAGTSTGAAWATLYQFTENARSPGDKVIMRRGTTAAVGSGSFLDFTSNGTYALPIEVEADFDDAWGDFATSAQTYTLTQGSKTATASATITGISVGDWIYNSTDSDDPRRESYEVAAVSGTTLTLKLPFKGTGGSGKTLTVMPPNPVFGVGGASDLVFLSGDDHWFFNGLDATGAQANGTYYVTGAAYGIIVGNSNMTGVGNLAAQVSNQSSIFIFNSYILGGNVSGLQIGDDSYIQLKNCVMDGNSGAADRGIYLVAAASEVYLQDVLVKDCIVGIDCQISALVQPKIYGNNVTFSGNTTDWNWDADDNIGLIAFSDYNGTLNKTGIATAQSGSDTTFITESDSTTVRTGGSPVSVKITPSDYIGTGHWSTVQLIADRERGAAIYADTTSRTYTFYFKTANTTDWTANPTASQLYIEAEYYCNSGNCERATKRSTGTVNFTGSTDWQSISLTVQPARAGVIYFKVKYAKPKESGKTNVFYTDPAVVIS